MAKKKESARVQQMLQQMERLTIAHQKAYRKLNRAWNAHRKALKRCDRMHKAITRQRCLDAASVVNAAK